MPSAPASIDDVLGLVGLADRAAHAVSGFSKGMQQRLGLGVALLGDPALVILDEPTSALDPIGRMDVRGILRTARDRGAAVFLNSHLLSEVERVCDRVAIVDRGRVVAEGPLSEVLGRQRDANPGRGARGRAPSTASSPPSGRRPSTAAEVVVADLDEDRVPDLVAALVGLGVRVHEVRSGRESLEQRFLELVGHGSAPAGGVGAVIAIARLTIGEAARRKILWVLVILAVLAVSLVGWGVSRLVDAARESGTPEVEIRLVVSQILIFIAFQFGFVQAMTAAFLGSPAIASDLESGIALAVLARPIRRSSYLLGRWLGLAIVLVAYGGGSALLAITVVGAVSGYTPPSILAPVAFLAAEGLVILTLTLLLSTRLPPIGGGAIAVVAFGLAWMAGTIERVGIAIARPQPRGEPAVRRGHRAASCCRWTGCGAA